MENDAHRCRWNDEDGETLIMEIERLQEQMSYLSGHDQSGQDHLEEMVVLAEERDRYLDVVAAAAALNCAKAPYGKHYKDPIYCGVCTSCQARAALGRPNG